MNEPKEMPRYAPSGFFALRTPLLPIDELLSWSADLSAASVVEDTDRVDAAYRADLRLLRSRLREIVLRTEVREALFVASPDLEGRLDVCLNDPESDAGQKMERTLVRYVSRMAGRPTPFGLCSGCSVGTIAVKTKLVLKGRDQYRRHTRLDMDYVVALAQSLASDPAVQSELLVYPNSSLYTTSGRTCYAEARRGEKGWTHHKIALERNDYLDITLKRAESGAHPEALAAALVEDDPGATIDEAREYVGELIRNQVLVPELIPPVTGPEPIHGIAARLRMQTGIPAANLLEQMHQSLARLDLQELGAQPAVYRDIARRLEALPAKVELGRVFQVDMVKPVVEATLGSDVIAEIMEGVTILQRMSRGSYRDSLARFRDQFTARYEGREVSAEIPLVEALDSELGVGFDSGIATGMEASSLLEGLTFPSPVNEAATWGALETGLLRKLSQALTSGVREIRLEVADLDELAVVEPLPLPDAFSVMGTVTADSEDSLAKGDFHVLLAGAVGPSGARILGRFCHADPLLLEHVERHLRAEEALHPDAIFAEIVHLPESRMGNILARPVLRAHEIPYLGRSGVPKEYQIPITDLMVTVVGKDVILRSRRLGRRVIPRLTSAHNFSTGQEIYRFLGALQGVGVTESLAWDWGPLRAAPDLPRVVAGRIVLSRATWRIDRDVLQNLGRAQSAARYRAVHVLRSERRLPRWVAVQDGDNELPVDLDNALSVESFVDLIKGREQATLVELFPEPDKLVAQGPEGRFVHEFVVPFVRTSPMAAEPSPPASMNGTGPLGETRSKSSVRADSSQGAPATIARIQSAFHRSFSPGSEWLFVKYYLGPSTVDRVLRDVVAPVVREVSKSRAADQWFFVRYGDPNWHLRVRFHGDAKRLLGEVFPALQAAAAPLIADGRIQRVQLDTYEREVERYGGPDSISFAEHMFHADSRAVIKFVTTSEDARAESRWRLAIVGIDRLLTDMGFELNARLGILKQMSTAFATEHRVNSVLRRQLNDKFRMERKGLELLIASEEHLEQLMPGAHEVFSRRSAEQSVAIAELRELEKSGRLCVPLAEVAVSLIHMHVNRLLPSAHRAQEVVLYDFLKRIYESQFAQV